MLPTSVGPTSSATKRRGVSEPLTPSLCVGVCCGCLSVCVMCFWSIDMPFFMCTREKLPWGQFAESAENGPSTRLVQEVI